MLSDGSSLKMLGALFADSYSHPNPPTLKALGFRVFYPPSPLARGATRRLLHCRSPSREKLSFETNARSQELVNGWFGVWSLVSLRESIMLKRFPGWLIAVVILKVSEDE